MESGAVSRLRPKKSPQPTLPTDRPAGAAVTLMILLNPAQRPHAVDRRTVDKASVWPSAANLVSWLPHEPPQTPLSSPDRAARQTYRVPKCSTGLVAGLEIPEQQLLCQPFRGIGWDGQLPRGPRKLWPWRSRHGRKPEAEARQNAEAEKQKVKTTLEQESQARLQVLAEVERLKARLHQEGNDD